MTANIRHVLKTHDNCAEQEWGVPRGFPGDVRRCEHGKVQVLVQVPLTARVQGPGTNWWRTLSPFWDRNTYKAAVQALEAQK